MQIYGLPHPGTFLQLITIDGGKKTNAESIDQKITRANVGKYDFKLQDGGRGK